MNYEQKRKRKRTQVIHHTLLYNSVMPHSHADNPSLPNGSKPVNWVVISIFNKISM
jgi:hypothetical protein